MEPRLERRKPQPDPDEGVSPEVLALLASCGGPIRATDRAAIEKARGGSPGRHNDVRGNGGDRRAGDRRQGAPSPTDHESPA